MKKIVMFPVLVLLVVLCGCNRGGRSISHYENLGNSPYQTDTIMFTYAHEPQRALELLDSALVLGNVNDFEGQLIRATIYSKSLVLQNQDSAIIICEQLLQHDSVKYNLGNRESVIDLLINISRAKADDNEYLKWTTQKAEICRLNGEEIEMYRQEAEIGMVMTHLGRTEKGLEKIANSIEKLDEAGSVDRMDAFIISVKRMITVLTELGRYAEVIPLAQRVLGRLDHYEKNSDSYAEDSYRLSRLKGPSDRNRYIDFSRAQANGFMAIAYAEMGEKEQARKHLADFDGSSYGKSFSARKMIMPAQMALGMYDEAMATGEEMIKKMGPDTMNANYAKILMNRSIAARAKGRTEEAFDMIDRYTKLNKILNDSLHKSEAQNYAARYHAKEQELKIQEVENKNNVVTIIMIAIAILFVVAAFASYYYYRQRQQIAKKNRALVKMINRSQIHSIDETYDEDDNDEERGDLVEGSSLFNVEKFAMMDAAIRSERIYSNPNLQRQDICERFDINRIMLNNMLQQNRGNASLPNYINSIRLEEAVKLLRENPDMSITYIAKLVGFTPANLRKQFIRNYGMTPMEYRQNL